MKNLVLKQITITGVECTLDYRAELLGICSFSYAGVTVEEIPVYLALSRKLQAAGDHVELTNAEHAILVDRLRSHRWRVIVPEILQFCEEVATAPEIDHANE